MQEKQNASLERQAELKRKRLGVDKDGFSADKDGNRIVQSSDVATLTGIVAFLKAAGVDDDKAARDIAREFADENGEITYHRRSLVEIKMHCFKRLGERVMARTFERQVLELHIRVALLNFFTQLGCATTLSVASVHLRAGVLRITLGLCNKAPRTGFDHGQAYRYRFLPGLPPRS